MNEYVQTLFKMKHVGGKNITLLHLPLYHHSIYSTIKFTYTTQHSTAIQDSCPWYIYYFFHNISSTHHFKPQYLTISAFHFITQSSSSQYHTTTPHFWQLTTMGLHSTVHTLRAQLLQFTSVHSPLHSNVTQQHHSSNSSPTYISIPQFTPLRVQLVLSTSSNTFHYHSTHHSAGPNVHRSHTLSQLLSL